MKIAHITIRNCFGIKFLEISPGNFNEISGANGEGKTSILKSIKAALGHGEDATLLRKGAEQGEVVLLMDDPESTKIRLPLSQSGKVGPTLHKGGVPQNGPATTIRALSDAVSVNPVEFLRAKDKDRVNVLLDSLPVQPSAERLSKIVGYEVELASNLNALAQIDLFYNTIFADRTATNRAHREKHGSINQLNATLPPDDGLPPADATQLEAKLGEIDAVRDAALTDLDGKMDVYRADHEGKLAKIDEEIARLQALIQEQRTARDVQAQWWVNAQGGYGKKKTTILDAHRESRDPVTQQLAAIRADALAATRAKVTRENIANLTREANDLQDDITKQTTALDTLTAYKVELLDELPIKGLEVRDNKVYRDGIVFESLNTAQQVEIAIEIGRLRCGELGVMCVDGLELLDDAHFEAFREASLNHPELQLFVTRRTNGPLEIDILD